MELHSVSLSGISLHNFSSLFLQVRVRALSSNLTCVLGCKAFKQMNQSEAVCSYAMIQTHSKSEVNYSVIKLSSLNHEKATCSKACLEHNCKIIVRGRVSDLLIDHFTVSCLVAWPLNESEAGGDLASIETSLLFSC